MNGVRHLWLASASPRRRALLAQIGVPCRQQGMAVDESLQPNEPAAVYVQRLAQAKAAALWRQLPVAERPGFAVLGADTAVVIDGRIVDKPAGRTQAIDGLLALSDRWHEVLTAVALVSVQGESRALATARVRLAAVDRAEAEAYWDTGEPVDKAGGYAVQGFGAVLVAALEGSYSAVVGLPLFETAQLLREHGIAVWQEPGT